MLGAKVGLAEVSWSGVELGFSLWCGVDVAFKG